MRTQWRARQPQVAGVAAVFGALAIVAASMLVLPSQGASADPTTLCGGQHVSVAAGEYVVQNNEWNSNANECVTTDGNADFTVAANDMTTPPGAPGGYPSIYQGCHWGSCTSGGLAANPVEAADMTPGEVTTSWATAQPTGDGNMYDVAYDIWYNRAATTNHAPDCAEVMVWLGHQGSVRPYGTAVATNVDVGGANYTVWEGVQTTEPTISYEMTTPATSVSNLDLYPITRDAVSRGYISDSCYLVSVEAGFELWQGGVGLATSAFSVHVDPNGTGSPSPSPTGTPSPTVSPTTTAGPTPTATRTPTSTATPSTTPSTTASASATATASARVTATNAPAPPTGTSTSAVANPTAGRSPSSPPVPSPAPSRSGSSHPVPLLSSTV
jgi:hypothetical protein